MHDGRYAKALQRKDDQDMNDFLERIKNGNCSTAELVLTGACLVLAGVVIGMKIAPARAAAYGSFNGNQGSVAKPDEIKELVQGIKGDSDK